MLHQRRARLRVWSANSIVHVGPSHALTYVKSSEHTKRARASAMGNSSASGERQRIAATHNPRVKALVYVAALAPDQGETVADVFYRAAPHPRAPKLAPDSHGLIYMPESAFVEAVAPNATAAEQALLAAVQRPLSPACITAPVTRPRWHDLPSWYLVAQQDYMIVPETQRFMAQRMRARIRAHEVDHTPMVTAPTVVIDIIQEALAEVSTG